ncbi:MAG: PRC-barrel domain-containing protein, partial [Pseudomonadota bacterium]
MLTLAVTAAVALTTSLAFAETPTIKKQTTQMMTSTQSANYLTSIDSKAWLGSKVIGMPVYTSATDERIGEVNNIVIEPNGQIAALVVGV